MLPCSAFSFNTPRPQPWLLRHRPCPLGLYPSSENKLRKHVSSLASVCLSCSCCLPGPGFGRPPGPDRRPRGSPFPLYKILEAGSARHPQGVSKGPLASLLVEWKTWPGQKPGQLRGSAEASLTRPTRGPDLTTAPRGTAAAEPLLVRCPQPAP